MIKKYFWLTGFLVFASVGMFFSIIFYKELSISMLVFGIALEAFKSLFIDSAYKDIISRKINIITLVFIILGIISTVLSLSASMSTFLNVTENTKNNMYVEIKNPKYLKLLENINDNNLRIEELKKQIEELELKRDSAISKLDPSYTIGIDRLMTSYNNPIKEKQVELISFQKENSSLTEKISTTEEIIKQKKESKGNIKLFNDLSIILNKDIDQLYLIFYFIMAFTLEFCIISSKIQSSNVMKESLITLQNKKCNEHSLQNKIDYITQKKCNEPDKKIVMNSLQDNNESIENTESNESIETEINNKNKTKENIKDSLQNSLQIKKCNEDENSNVMNPLQNEKCNEADKKNVINSLQELSVEIDKYILENYKINELINVKEIKEKFEITQQRKWAKIIDMLSTASIYNARLRRTNKSKKNIKLIK